MCHPAVAIVASLASTAVSVYAAQQQAKQAEAVGEYNAKMGEVQAKAAEDQGIVAEDQHRAKIRQIMGQQKAAMGASGVEGGSFDNVLDSTVQVGAEDINMIRLNAQREAWGLRTGALRDRWQGNASASGLRLGSYGTLLGGLASSYGTYNNFYTSKGVRR